MIQLQVNSKVKSFLKHQTIETVITSAVVMTVLVILFLIRGSGSEFLSVHTEGNVWWAALITKQMFFPLMLVVLYVITKLIIETFHTVAVFKKRRVKKETNELKAILVSFFYISTYISVLSIALYVLTLPLYKIPADKVIAASTMLMNFDYAVFGSYVSLSIQENIFVRIIDVELVSIYKNLGLVISSVSVLLIILKRDEFRKFILSFILVSLISLPIWLAVPAISPAEMYIDNIFNLSIYLPGITNIEALPFGISLSAFLALLENVWSNAEKELFAVTSFPSMHIAWGFLVVFYTAHISKKILLISVPWFILLSLSTVYTLQHYAVDIPAGIVIAILTILLVKFLFKQEKKFYKGTYKEFFLIDSIQKDLKQLLGR